MGVIYYSSGMSRVLESPLRNDIYQHVKPFASLQLLDFAIGIHRKNEKRKKIVNSLDLIRLKLDFLQLAVVRNLHSYDCNWERF